MIEVNFINENKEITSNSVYQWDYGRKLPFITDAVIQVHFRDKSSDRTEVKLATSENDYYKVSIPDVLLEKSYSINAFICSVAVIPRKKTDSFIIQYKQQYIYKHVLNTTLLLCFFMLK